VEPQNIKRPLMKKLILGANINFNSNGAYASGLSKYSERILQLMADGALIRLL
jgi:hypothetical protein